jgi:hypothetical protein
VLQTPQTFHNDLKALGVDICDLLSYILENEDRKKKITVLKNTTISILRAISQAAGFMETYLARGTAGKGDL